MNNSAQSILPSVNSIEQHSDSVILTLTITADLRCFKGHFDDAAVTPGVVQLEWAVTFARQYLAMQGDVQEVSVLKFQKLLLPNMTVQLDLIKKSANKFTFCYHTDDEKFSSARIELS